MLELDFSKVTYICFLIVRRLGTDLVVNAFTIGDLICVSCCAQHALLADSQDWPSYTEKTNNGTRSNSI